MYTKNLKALKRNQDYLYNKIIDFNIEEADQDIDRVSLCDTREKAKALIIEKDQKTYRMNSNYRPCTEADRWVEQYTFENMKKVVTLYGFGNGIFAQALLNRINKDDVLIVYEPSAHVFMYMMEHLDLTEYFNNSNLYLVVEGINGELFTGILNQVINSNNVNQISRIYCTHPHYDTVFPERYTFYWKTVNNNYIHSKISYNTQVHFGKRFIYNIAKNIKYINSINMITDEKKDKLKNSVVAIIAAGPSAAKSIEELKIMQDKVFIIAVDRMIDYVLDAGIQPDMIASIDPAKPLELFTRRELSIPMLCMMESNWEIMDIHKGRKFINDSETFIGQFFDLCKLQRPIATKGGSVALAAFYASIKLGFRNIILIGQDLAYRGNVSHVGGEQMESFEESVLIDGVHGDKLPSRYDWIDFKITYEDAIIKNPELNVIDVKDEGAKIEGTARMELKEAVDLYGADEGACKKLLDDIEPVFNKENLIKIRGLVGDNINELKLIKKKVESSMDAASRLLAELDKNGATSPIAKESLKEMKKTNEFTMKSPIYCLIELFISSEFYKDMINFSKFSEDAYEAKKTVYNSTRDMFQVVSESVDYIMPLLEETIDCIV